MKLLSCSYVHRFIAQVTIFAMLLVISLAQHHQELPHYAPIHLQDHHHELEIEEHHHVSLISS
jgi:hypothetical protein